MAVAVAALLATPALTGATELLPSAVKVVAAGAPVLLKRAVLVEHRAVVVLGVAPERPVATLVALGEPELEAR